MPTFLVLHNCEPEQFLNDDGSSVHSDPQKLALNTHRYVHEHLDNQTDAVATVTNPELHERLESAWNEEPTTVYAIMVHPPDTTSGIEDIYADRDTAETEANAIHEQDDRIEVAVMPYEVYA